MTIRVITVEREYGAGGGVIVEKIAKRLGWELWDHALTEEIARRLGCGCEAVEEHEEKRDPAHYRLFKAFMRGSFEGSLNAPRIRMVDTECVREVVRKLLPEIAEPGHCVIVGRGSAFYLGSRNDAFHVFVYAPFHERVCRLRAIGESEEKARELAETVDRDRAEFIQQYFQVEWPGRHHFHLMVNSGMGDDVATGIILDAVARCEKGAN
jgi:Cytidylate kinase-like family